VFTETPTRDFCQSLHSHFIPSFLSPFLSARLMQRATVTGAGVLTDTPTRDLCELQRNTNTPLAMYTLGTIEVKGKTIPITIWQPLLMFEKAKFPVKNMYELEPLFEDRDPMEIKEGELCNCFAAIFCVLFLLFS
jgi:hypothetical protein